ncbi:mitogen-activated protein kinase kinase kinase [Tanacetum coccineum]
MVNSERPPDPLDFFIWTVEDVGLWLEEINLGGYRQVFKENGVNGEYLESMSVFTTEQILRFIRRCHMKWGDFITLCKELRRIKGYYSYLFLLQDFCVSIITSTSYPSCALIDSSLEATYASVSH